MAMANLFVDTRSSMTDLLDAIAEFVLPLPRSLFSAVAAKDTVPQSSFVLTPSRKLFEPLPAKENTPKSRLVFKSSSSSSTSTLESSVSSTDSTESLVHAKSSSYGNLADCRTNATVNTVPPLFQCESLTPALFFDAEGVQLSRHGELCILELHVHHRLHRRTYIIDICALGDLAFTNVSTDGRYTLKSILENATVPKVFFDVRMDSDALYGQYSIALAGVIDLQLMEVASRTRAGRADGRVKGLKWCLAVDVDMKEEEWSRVQRVKARGKKLFAPEEGGGYEVFQTRPLAQEMIDYCVVDVVYMPDLYIKYNMRLKDTVSLTAEDGWAGKIIQMSKARVALAKGPEFRGSPRSPWY
ncbi:hypothetical protein IMSHALPRED_010085 [Imshaugia aleurites]|uniref:3'-5' exonuclease domain-containing protein n=1 Tax=Imshaugia aleurites TaxID=172621 RepID=A0A8H3IZF4_9LECA|nr:hypothetical protein IMSHALPRED_010085 [Imshaugia aleurites]